MINRRDFIHKTAVTGLGLGIARKAPFVRGLDAPNERIAVAIIGMNGRGTGLARGFARLPGAEVAYVCDVDERNIARGIDTVREVQARAPRGVKDLREILDDPEVDAVAVATPNHWHAPASIMACAAGKHVYLEKPGSHNPREGELSVAAARVHDRVVQMGNQRRSWPGVIAGIRRVREGAIGDVHYSRGWYANTRGSIGRAQASPPPSWLDWELWQGPAPRKEFRDNYVHYNWHWFWHWGTGESGNNGMHAVDVCRWGLDVDYPIRVVSSGGRHFFDDDQETPDTHLITLDFPGGKTVMWEGVSCNRYGIEGTTFGVTFHGEDGTVKIIGNGYELFDRRNEKVEQYDAEAAGREVEVTGPGFDLDAGHLTNFLEAIRNGTSLNSDIQEGYKSTLLMHLGNIAYRTGRALNCNPADGHILDDPQAMELWAREYEPGWEPRV